MTARAQKQYNSVSDVRLPLRQRLLVGLQSEHFRQPVRVALAMVIAYYISLSMGWDRPHWAGLAVALCSLGTVGDSLNKGLLRIFGTFLAGFITLLLIALFPQERWYYLLGVTVHIAFCTYMMGHSSRWYFWFIAGYVMPLLALTAGPVAANAFETVVLRLQQTTMGVIVYTLVSLLLWPCRTTPVLTHTVTSLVDVQRRLLGHHFALLSGTPNDGELSTLRAQAAGIVARLPTVVDGAEVDSFEVWETRHRWRACVHDFTALNETMERWRQGFRDLKPLDLRRLMPGLPAFGAELDARLAAVAHMLANELPLHQPQSLSLAFNGESLDSLSSFERAALIHARDQLQRIEQETRVLFDSIADIRGFSSTAQVEHTAEAFVPPWTIDPDRLASAVRAFTGVWIILLAWFYLPGLPMPAGVIPVAAALAIQLGLFPEIQLRTLIVPLLGSVAFAGAFHILVMPHLDSFLGLGTGIFIAIFLMCFLLAKPEQALVRGVATSFFVMIISVKDQQTYSFLFVVNFALISQLALIAIWFASWIPISFLPQQIIFKQLSRFLRSCDWLALPLHQDSASVFRRLQYAFHVHEVTTLPGKIGRWMAALPDAALGNGTREQTHALVDCLQVLGDRMRELFELQDAPQSGTMVSALVANDIRTWRLGIQEISRTLAADPACVDAVRLRARMNAKLEVLDTHIKKALNATREGSTSYEEIDHIYRLLGAYRGVSEALIAYSKQAEKIDWACLREVRF